MKIKELRELTDKHYIINCVLPQDENYDVCAKVMSINKEGKYEVYVEQRNDKINCKVYDTEEEACEAFVDTFAICMKEVFNNESYFNRRNFYTEAMEIINREKI
ncbi:MAG: hypothetical protein LBR30_00440 [Clostridioides sp.]|jgi:hypothetical protein|nr:hypothetical protein [Clostridioides sp.]